MRRRGKERCINACPQLIYGKTYIYMKGKSLHVEDHSSEISKVVFVLRFSMIQTVIARADRPVSMVYNMNSHRFIPNSV